MTDLESAAAEIVRDLEEAVALFGGCGPEFAARIVALAQDYHITTTEALRRQLHEAMRESPWTPACTVSIPLDRARHCVRREHSPL